MATIKIVNDELLKDKITASGLKIGYICETLGISREAFDKKRNGETSVRGSEKFTLTSLLNLTGEDERAIFFTDEVGNLET